MKQSERLKAISVASRLIRTAPDLTEPQRIWLMQKVMGDAVR